MRFPILLATLLFCFSGYSQTILVQEGFETLPLQFSSSGTANWARTQTLVATGNYADSARLINAGDTAKLSSISFSTIGMSFVALEFDHICKAAFTDGGYIEISIDNGISWSRLTATQYTGQGQFASINNRFTSVSYFIWDPANGAAIPQNSWWRHETFNISAIAGNQPNVKLRFILYDGDNSGGAGNYGWLIDNIKVTGSGSELTPPSINMFSSALEDTLFHTGPFNIMAELEDASGIDTALLIFQTGLVIDTIGMQSVNGDTFAASIPSQAYNAQVCYRIEAVDNSGNANTSRFPAVGCHEFIVLRPLNLLQIGQGTSKGYIAPIFNDSVPNISKYSRHISLIRSSDLGHESSYIRKIAWEKSAYTATSTSNGHLKIYLKNTNIQTVPTNANAFVSEASSATLVYDTNLQSIPQQIGWLEFNLNKASFLYNGYDDLMILVEWEIPGAPIANNIHWNNHQSIGNAVSFIGNTAGPSTLSALDERPNTRLFLEPFVYNYDAGISEILGSSNIVQALTPIPLDVRIKNYGDQTLNKVNIHHSIDGIIQPVFAWTGSINTDIVSSSIIISTQNLSNGQHIVKAWTSQPNDSTDQKHSNDTISKSVYACHQILNGSYTLGNAGADFQTFAQMADALTNCGINGPTTINIQPGTYTEHFELNGLIPGASATNTVTIKSATGIAGDVVIQYDAQSSDKNFLIHLNGSSFLRFKQITLKPLGNLFATAVHLEDSSTRNQFIDCRLILPSGSVDAIGFLLVGNGSNGNIFQNNIIEDAYRGFDLSGNSMGNQVLGNKVLRFRNSGIRAYSQDSLLIRSNLIESSNLIAHGFGIDMENSNVIGTIQGNTINVSTSGSGRGIYLYGNNYLDVNNNMVNVSGNSTNNTSTTLDVNNCDGARFAYNTFRLFQNTSSATTAKFNAFTTNFGQFTLLNNIFANTSGGMAISYSTTFINNNMIASSDHNCFYSNGVIIASIGAGGNIPTSLGIGGIIAQMHTDSNSVLADPFFYSGSNLHSFSPVLDGAAMPINGIASDIDGQVRNPNTPDIGADEYSIALLDAGVLEFVTPLPLDTQSRVVTLKVLARNFGSNSIQSMSLGYRLNNGSVISLPWTGSLGSGAIDTFSIGSFTVPALDFTLTAFTILNGDTLNLNDSITQSFYGQALIDLKLMAMTTPVDGCNLGNEIVKAQVKNLGVGAVPAGSTISYQVKGSSNIVSETLAASLNPGASTTHTFATPINMQVSTGDSLFRIKCWVKNTNDPIALNDSLEATALSLNLLPAPVINDTSISYGSSVTLNAQSNFNVNWYSSNTATTPFSTGASFTTPVLFDTTTYYAEANTNIPALDVSIGNGTTSNTSSTMPCPYGTAGTMNGAREQYLFLASELQAMGVKAGNINTIGFYIQSTPYAAWVYGFTIRMAQTTQSSLTTTFINTGLIQVHQSNFQQGAGWNLHPLTTPYAWDGVSNLIVEICNYVGNGGLNPSVLNTQTSFSSVITSTTGGNPCGNTTGISSSSRPNIRIKTDPVLGCNGYRTSVQVNVPPPATEGMVSTMLLPQSSCGLAATSVSCRVVNLGTSPIPAGIPVQYRVNTGNYISPEYTATPIPVGAHLDFTFNTQANLNAGLSGTYYSLTFKIAVPGDNFSFNDTLRVDSIFSDYTPVSPQIPASITQNYGAQTLLTATSTDSVYWFSDSLASHLIGSGFTYLTDPLYDSTTIYAGARKTIPLTTYTIGTGTGSNTVSIGPSPYGAGSLAHSAKNQFLIPAAELKAMGMIKGEFNSIAFNVLQASGIALNNFSLMIGHTSKTEMSSFETGLIPVYSSAVHYDQLGWNTYNFAAPFYWDGVSNIIIQTCFTNSTYGTFGRVYNTITSYISSLNYLGTAGFNCGTSSTSNSYTRRPNVRITAKGFGNCLSPLSATKINLNSYPPLDAGILSITNPIATASSLIQEPVKVVLKNYGQNTITSATIMWSERGNTIHNYQWTGLLPHNATDTVLLANHVFKGGATTLKAWTSLPNAGTDTVNSNDSSSVNLNICMSGNYSIGQGSTDYPGIQEAINDAAFCGICDDTYLSIDTGFYLGSYRIPAINGTGPNSWLNIRSQGNDSSTVHVSYSTNALTDYVFKLDSASYINIEALTLNSTGSTQSKTISLAGASHHIRIARNVLNGPFSTSNAASVIHSNDKNVNNIHIINNQINNGYYGIYFLADFYTKHHHLLIEKNRIQDFFHTGIFANYQDSITIRKNKLLGGLISGISYGIYVTNAVNGGSINGNTIEAKPSAGGYGIFTSNADGIISSRFVISNNFVIVNTGNSSNKGIECTSNDYATLAYNSVLVSSGDANGSAIKIGGGTNQIVRNNNISINSGYAIDVSNPSGITSCNNNNYFVSPGNTRFAKWVIDVNDLTALKNIDAAHNAASISADPFFYGANDLHTFSIQLNGAAATITNVSDDIDGDPRDPSTPDIGADEFTPAAFDLAMMQLVKPEHNDCGFLAADSIIVRVQNFGINTLNFSTNPVNINVNVQGVNPAVLNYTLNTGTLASGMSKDVTVSSNYNLSIPGPYLFQIHHSMSVDGNHLNDTLPAKQIISYPNISTYPFLENFNFGTNYTFKQFTGSQSKISVTNLAASSGNYGMQFEGGSLSGYQTANDVASAFNNTSHVAKAQTCQIDASNQPALMMRIDLRQTYQTVANDSWFRVMIYSINGYEYLKDINGDSTFRPVTPTSDPFTTHFFPLNQYLGQTFSISLESSNKLAYTNGGQMGDLALVDNFSLYIPNVDDAGVAAITSMAQAFSKAGSSQQVSVTVSNFGTTTLVDIPLSYSINGSTPVNDTLFGSLPPNSSAPFTFSIPFIVLPGKQTVCAYTRLGSDGNLNNDSICLTFTGLSVLSLNYFDDYESVDRWISTGTNMQWELGTPNTPIISSAHNGLKAWVTKLNSNYLINSTEYLYSPYVTIPSTPDTVLLEFWHNMNVIPNNAFGNIQYSINGGVWVNLGYIGMSGSSNWYNTSVNGLHVWGVNTNGWLPVSLKLDPLTFNTGQDVQFRFRFQSLSSSSTAEGWAIDDFSLSLPQTITDLALSRIIPPGSGWIGSNNQVAVMIQNLGNNPESGFPVSYTLNTGQAVVETYTSTLLPGDSAQFIFNTICLLPFGLSQLCAETMHPADNNTLNDKKCINILISAIDEQNRQEFSLGQNYPNPFTHNTHIPFYMPKPGTISIVVRNLLGEIVFSDKIEALQGDQEYIFHNEELRSGMYIYQITCEEGSRMRTMVIEK
jgi:hypothetical protein